MSGEDTRQETGVPQVKGLLTGETKFNI